ncbi:MAG: NAD(P)-dependent dehydrogenase (short-subunit alcohol dehydrogenase family) [Parasphingorhabdus sp.]|jgi:NAD(P)-dependent dehydrogenase (short-subunit alcohol dehydrogenase family)
MNSPIILSEIPPGEAFLTDQVILVTGAGAGIGREICLQAARAGAALILLDKNQRALDTLYDEIVKNGGAEPVQITEDLSKTEPGQWPLLCDQINATFGKLDGLIHCAAEAMPLTPLEHTGINDWHKAIQSNVTSPWLLTKALLPLLRHSTGASIIFSSGEAARQGKAYWNITGVAWGALDSLVGIWHEELEANDHIRINSLDPGAVNTSMRSRSFPAEDPAQINSVEVAAAAYLFLLNEKSNELSGQRLTLNKDKLTISHR